MAIRGRVTSSEVEKLLSRESIQIIETFLTYYSSEKVMRSSVNRLLCNDLVKFEITKLTIEDYSRVFPDGSTSPQVKNKQSFFRFLYCYDYLERPSGFEKIWIKETEINHFENLKQRSVGEVEKAKDKPLSTINIEELIAIQKIIEVDSTKTETLKMQFCWYAIFELGLEVTDLKNRITSKNFAEGKLRWKEKFYEVPAKYYPMFDTLNKEGNLKNGFVNLNDIIGNLGKLAKLNRKLIPVDVKSTRKTYMVSCANCHDKYTNLSHNWLSMNNRIVCVSCAEMLKKNLILK